MTLVYTGVINLVRQFKFIQNNIEVKGKKCESVITSTANCYNPYAWFWTDASGN